MVWAVFNGIADGRRVGRDAGQCFKEPTSKRWKASSLSTNMLELGYIAMGASVGKRHAAVIALWLSFSVPLRKRIPKTTFSRIRNVATSNDWICTVLVGQV